MYFWGGLVKHSALLLAAASALFAASAHAQVAGLYLGGSFGQSRAKIDDESVFAGLTHGSVTKDESDAGYKLYAGYRVNQNFAIEGGYANLGEVSASTTVTAVNGVPVPPQNLRVKWTTSDGLFLAALIGAPVASTGSVYAKIGVYTMKLEAKAQASGSASDSETGQNLLFGLGAQYDFAQHVGARIEWERFKDVGGDNVGKGDFDLFSIGILYRF